MVDTSFLTGMKPGVTADKQEICEEVKSLLAKVPEAQGIVDIDYVPLMQCAVITFDTGNRRQVSAAGGALMMVHSIITALL